MLQGSLVRLVVVVVVGVLDHGAVERGYGVRGWVDVRAGVVVEDGSVDAHFW